eukprot:1449740-Rhodomonas_salina.4
MQTPEGFEPELHCLAHDHLVGQTLCQYRTRNIAVGLRLPRTEEEAPGSTVSTSAPNMTHQGRKQS